MRFHIGNFRVSIMRLPPIPRVATPELAAMDAAIEERRRRHGRVSHLLDRRASMARKARQA